MAASYVAERAAKFSDKAKESMDSDSTGVVTKARSLMSGDAQFFSATVDLDQVRKQLDSDNLSHKKEAMKRVLAQVCLGQDMAPLFPDVVKNVHATSIELRKLIYYFIVHYCEDRPNEALLSISAFQHDLVDQSMHVRALALRTLSSIRIPAIHPVVIVAVKKAATDLSGLVRRTAVNALVKTWKITNGEESVDTTLDLIAQFLGDKSMEVVGSAARAFRIICPTRHDLIHKHFRRICRCLLEADEWGQVAICEMLLHYSRAQFPDPEKPVKKKKVVVADDDDEEESSDEESKDDELQATLDVDSDLRLLLTSVKPMLHSTNRALVVAAVTIYFHLAPKIELDIVAKPLIRVLNGAPSGHFIALKLIYQVATAKPKAFANFIKDFFLTGQDNPSTRMLKIRLIAKLVTRENQVAVLAEFRSYLRSYDSSKVVEAVKGLGLIALAMPESAPTIMKLVTPLLANPSEEVVTEAVVVLRQLVVQSNDKLQTYKIIQKLSQKVLNGSITAPPAKATIIWLVGENIKVHSSVAKVAPDFFRLFLKNFAKEAHIVKTHVINLGAKIWFNLEGEGGLADRFKAMFFYMLELVKYDASYDVRDQGRMLETAQVRDSTTFAALKESMMEAKPQPQHKEKLADRKGFELG